MTLSGKTWRVCCLPPFDMANILCAHNWPTDCSSGSEGLRNCYQPIQAHPTPCWPCQNVLVRQHLVETAARQCWPLVSTRCTIGDHRDALVCISFRLISHFNWQFKPDPRELEELDRFSSHELHPLIGILTCVCACWLGQCAEYLQWHTPPSAAIISTGPSRFPLLSFPRNCGIPRKWQHDEVCVSLSCLGNSLS